MMYVDPESKTLTQASISENFLETLREAQLDFDLTKIKVFSARGEVLYSTESKDIGDLNTNAYFTDIVAKGKNFSKVVHKDEKTMEEEVVKKDVVETYIPLMRDQHFIGAFEIYYDITYIGHSVKTFIEKSRIIIIFVALILLICILSISFSAINYLKKQIKTEKQMQILKEQVPSLYNLSPDEEDE